MSSFLNQDVFQYDFSLFIKKLKKKHHLDINCPPCERSKKRIRFKKFCRCEAGKFSCCFYDHYY